MILKERIALMARLGDYFMEDGDRWKKAKEEAFLQNPWFLPEYIDCATKQIARSYLQKNLLEEWVQAYQALSATQSATPEVGIVMAGNIPLVGFHDFLSVFISGCRQRIKLSSKDKALWHHILGLLTEWHTEVAQLVSFTDQLRSCQAYIATGSNNSARYFDYYFSKYPHIIRRNRSSVAVLTGEENADDLRKLADDICLYFGLGCRNVTQLLVPEGYDFNALKEALAAYRHHLEEPKYKNNYDYQLALILLNKITYEPAGPVLLVPSDSLFAPISVLHYRSYHNTEALLKALPKAEETQCVIARHAVLPEAIPTIPFGAAQHPQLSDYADQIDTLSFLSTLKKL